MRKQIILEKIDQLLDQGQQFAYDRWPKAESNSHSPYYEFEGWMAQVIDMARRIKSTIGSETLGLANRGRRAFQKTNPSGDQVSFDTAHGTLLNALKVARQQVNDLWSDEPVVEEAAVQH